MAPEFKAHLHAELQRARDTVLLKLDGLGPDDARRPVTATGTNLLGLAATGQVPWWPTAQNPVTLDRVLVHVATETFRHAGHADLLRELIDGPIARSDVDAGPSGEVLIRRHDAPVELACSEAIDRENTAREAFDR